MRLRITRVFTLLAASVALSSAATAQAAPAAPAKVDLTGTWIFSVTTGSGTGTPTVTLKQQGDSLTGHYSSQTLGEADLKGAIKDGKITFSFTAQVQGYSLPVSYTGTMENVDSMKGTVDLGEIGSGTFTATRKKL